MNMRSKMMTAVSAAALLAMAGAAVAQQSGGAGGTGGSGGAMQSPNGGMGAGGAVQNREPAASGAPQRDGADRAQSSPTPSTKQPSAAQGGPDKGGMTTDGAPKASAQQTREGQNNPATQGATDQKMGGAEKKDGTTVGSAPARQMTTEQRTTIRETVIRSGNAPRVANVNFSINVGVVVPSTVRVVEVPTTIVEIHPEWRGYRYFVVNDEIVIVEPRTLKIVAVLEV
jgi:hypothetical protein